MIDHPTAMMMNDFRFYHKDFLLGFLQVYKNLPCLWQIKHPEYHNKDKKNKGFDILIKKMKEIEPRADRNSVANKISNLRSVYKRECKRLLKLQPNKKPQELISENIWYFEHLHFLQDHRITATTTSASKAVTTTKAATPNKDVEEQSQERADSHGHKRKAETAAKTDNDEINGDDEPQAKLAKLQHLSTNEENAVKIENYDKLNEKSTECFEETEVLIPELILKTEPEEPAVDTEIDDRNDSDDLLSEIGASTFNSEHAHSDRAERLQNFDLMERNNFDRFDHMTSAWAGILRNLPRTQQIFAEKLINDVMFEAQLENLSRQSVVLATDSQKIKQNGFGSE